MNESTRGLIDGASFARMKDGAFLVNISRAPIIDRAALMDVLESDRLGGIALDVHYEEPSPPDDPLKNYPKALLTPHSAVAGRANATADMEELIANLAAGIG
jgi:phosphoglycerate dehydrogenase-like enzyme